jgi:NADPH-dependent 2,4-dienoyl-CoA reductase/sulfur reductase-like enzyme
MTTTDHDYDVAVVGGGPAGCSAGVFCARYGLDTLVFDRGRSSIQRCAHLENYLGFPAGIDIETFYELMHDHAREAGCELDRDLVESVEDAEQVGGFAVSPQEGASVTARRVIAAARYDGTYLRGLDDGAGETGMFETYEHDGEQREVFDREYADREGRTPIEGLYVASPAAETDRQAVIAAGRGARVGLAVVEDVRREEGYPEAVADRYDWVRREAELDDESAARERYREWFGEQVPDDHDLTEKRLVALREAEIDRRFGAYVDPEEIDARATAGQQTLLERIEDDLVLERAREIETDTGRDSIEAGE